MKQFQTSMLYLHGFFLILKLIWRSETFKCDKYGKKREKKKNHEEGDFRSTIIKEVVAQVI